MSGTNAELIEHYAECIRKGDNPEVILRVALSAAESEHDASLAVIANARDYLLHVLGQPVPDDLRRATATAGEAMMYVADMLRAP